MSLDAGIILRASIHIYFYISNGDWEVATIDDAAILKRAKELCEQDGVGWDRFSSAVPGARVLTDGDRRECLMRARDELVKETRQTEASQQEKAVGDKGDAAINPMPIATSERAERLEIPVAETGTLWPRRRVA